MPRSAPPTQRETRRVTAQAAAQLHGRFGQLDVRGRLQRLAALSDDERRNIDTERRRVRRAQDRALADRTTELMGELARYDLPVVQLLMAEFELQPCNLGVSGAMRLRFIELYGRSCHTKHAAPAEGVARLPEMAAVLRPTRSISTSSPMRWWCTW